MDTNDNKSEKETLYNSTLPDRRASNMAPLFDFLKNLKGSSIKEMIEILDIHKESKKEKRRIINWFFLYKFYVATLGGLGGLLVMYLNFGALLKVLCLLCCF